MMPCLEPVITTLAGELEDEELVTRGKRVDRPLITPKRLTSIVLWKYDASFHDPFRPIPAFKTRRESLPTRYQLSVHIEGKV